MKESKRKYKIAGLPLLHRIESRSSILTGDSAGYVNNVRSCLRVRHQIFNGGICVFDSGDLPRIQARHQLDKALSELRQIWNRKEAQINQEAERNAD